MDPKQQAAHDAILRGENILLTGPGGTGKTFVIREVLAQLAKVDRTVAVTATTGAAAVNLGIPDARTIDSFLKLKPKYHSLADYVSDKLRRGLREQASVETLIVDEVSMLTPGKFRMMREILSLGRHTEFIEKFENIPGDLDYVHRERMITVICDEYRDQLRSEPEAIQFVLLGDFHQLPYIQDKKEQRSKNPPQIFEMPEWSHLQFQMYELTTIHRQSDTRMQRALNSIRVGKYTDEARDLLKRCMARVPETGGSYIHLFPTNELRDAYNNTALRCVRGEPLKLAAVDTCDADDYHQNLFHRETKLPTIVQVKKGCQVILLKNLSQTLINGSIGTIVGTNPLAVRFTNGEERTIKQHKQEFYDTVFSEAIGRSVKIKYGSRTQYPLDLGYAFTMHKAQGMSLARVVVHLDPIYNAGIVYTALSRAKSEEGLIVRDCNLNRLGREPVPKAVLQFYERGNKRQSFEDVWPEISAKLIQGTTMEQLHQEYLSLDHPLRSKLLQKKRSFERLKSLDVQESRLLNAIRNLFGLKLSETVSRGALYIECPVCAASIDEHHLLLVGLFCTCGCPSKSLLDKVAEKYGWACYIIQESSEEISGTVEYVGVTTRGGVRLSEHAKLRFQNLRDYVIRCSLRLGETDMIQLLRPKSNVHLIGNTHESSAKRLVRSEIFAARVPLPLTISHWKNSNRLLRTASAAGILSSHQEWRKLYDPKCHLRGVTRCSHMPRCFLQEEENKRKGREWYYPFKEEEVEWKRQKRENEMVGEEVEETVWSIEAAKRIRNRGLTREDTKKRNSVNVQRLWDIGLLKLGQAGDWSPMALAQRIGREFPRSHLSHLVYDIRATVTRMSLNEKGRFVCPDALLWAEDKEMFGYVGNGDCELKRVGDFWEV
jgi:ATP-dependent DNA helicase PIF1